ITPACRRCRSMSLYLFAPLAWLAAACALLWLLHARELVRLWREPMGCRAVVVVESGDWGPGPASDAEMLGRLSRLLSTIRDIEGRPAVMTLGVVLGKPDGATILADEFRRYRRSTLGEPEYAAIVQAIKQGRAAGVFAL